MYKKVVTVYSNRERQQLHSLGYWVDREGHQLPVYLMSYSRLEKLVRTLGRWATKENEPLVYLRKQAIFPHIVKRIRLLNLKTEYAYLFELAAEGSVKVVHIRPNLVPSADEEYWEYYAVDPSEDELARMNLSANELRMDFS